MPDRTHPDTPFAERLEAFADALLDPDAPPPEGLVGPDGHPSARRFAVYRNNVVTGLIETLKAAFPVTRRLVGDDFFAALARAHAIQIPPTSPVMLDYGATFADFVGGFEPAAPLPYLRDVVRLERAWTEAYHAAEALPLSPGFLARIPLDELPRACLLLHPSVRLVRSIFPAGTLWSLHEDVEALRDLDLNRGGEDVMLSRPDADVALNILAPGAADFIAALRDGITIGDALTLSHAVDTRFDMAGGLVGLFEAGVVVGIGVQQDGNTLAAREAA